MKDLNSLGKLLLEAKTAEKTAKEQRLQIESQIYIALEESVGIPEKGTVHDGPFTLSRGQTEQWDQEKLEALEAVIPADLWPFTKVTQYKLDSAKRKVIAENHPHVYVKIYDALTIVPRKPSFKLDEEKLV